MAVVTKFKVYPNGRMVAGQFDETGEDKVQLHASSVAKSSGLDETAEHVRFTSEGVIEASEFVEV